MLIRTTGKNCNQCWFRKLQDKQGKAPKEVTEALRDIKDYVAFHQNVSVAMANLILLRRDSYLEHIKNGIKPDTWNMLRNTPMFGHGLFPDSVLATTEQDITKYESAGAAPGPGPGTLQLSSWRGNYRFKPYENLTKVLATLIKVSNHGVSFPGTGTEVGVMAGGPTLVFLRPEETSLINDNYHSVPTLVNPLLSRLDNKFSH